MKSRPAVVEKDDEDDVAVLVGTLHRTQQRLQQMAGRGVDAVTLPDGNVYFLVEAQESLRRTQAARDEAAALQAAILNGLPAHIALIDRNGVIVSVNDGWRRFSETNGLQDVGSGVGENYLEVCGQAGEGSGDEAPRAAAGIREVMSGAVREFSIEYPCHSLTEQRWFRLTVSPLEKDAPGGAVVMHVDITERRQAEEKIIRSRALMTMASRVGRLGAWTVDLPSLALTWSDEVRTIHEVPADYLPTVEAGIDFFAPEFRGAIREAVDACIREATPFDVELQIITAGGTRLWVRVIGEPLRDGAGVSTRIQGAIQDITDRKAAEQKLTRINGALKTLSNCNEALIRAEHEQDLLDKICGIAVEHGGYGMAWVGFAQNDKARRITPEAHAGDDEGYLSEMKDTWDENDPTGMGMAGRVIRSGEAEECEDVTKDAAFSLRLPIAPRHGYRSVIVLPLRDGSRTFGLLALHSAEEKSTSAEELRLLQELADDLAFGILNLRARIEKERLETAVLKVAASVSATVGTEFFEQLASNMAEALGAQAAFIVRTLPGVPPTGRAIAAVMEGELVDSFDYPIIGTPSENLLTRETCVITKNAAGLFPEARTIAALGAEGYAGQRLTSATGEPLGLLCVIFRKQIVNIDFVTSTLQIFAARAASEMERQQNDAQLRHQARLLDVAHDAIHLDDLDSRVIFWNKGAERLYGWSAEEALGRASDEMLHRSGADSLIAMKAIVGAGEWKGEAIKRTKDGRDIFVDMHWTLVRDGNGKPKSILAIETDITDRKAGEKELTRVHRALKIKLLSNCNETLIWAESERELLDKICQIVIDHGGYSMAWVGYAIDDEAHTITPTAHAGVENGYFSEVKLSWSVDQTAGWGPAGQAIRDGRTTVCDDISLEPGCSPYLRMAQERGYRCAICLPLHDGERTFGVLGIFSNKVESTSAEELNLLQELAQELAFGILNLRERADQRHAETSILKVAESVSAASGAEFFAQLARSMAEAVGAQAGFVSKMLPGEPLTARVVGAVVEGKAMENFDRLVKGTPSENLLTGETCVISRRVCERYPDAFRFLGSLDAQGYAGYRLTSSTGQQLGHLSVVFREPLKQTDFVTSTLRIFAARAASELERIETDSQVREQAALLDNARDAIIVRGLDHRILYWNQGAERLYGWTAAEAIGRLARDLLNADPAAWLAATETTLATGGWVGELQQMNKENRPLIVEVHWTLVRDGEGRPKSILCINTDITERKKMEEQYFRAQRLESIGTLASGLAHDLNNILAPIMMCAPLLRDVRSPDEVDKLLKAIEMSAERGAQIVSQVLIFGRGVQGERMPLRIAAIVHEIVQIAGETFPKNIRIEHRIAEGLSEIMGDITQWHQVVMNLSVNARDAMPDGGVLRITAENLDVDAYYASMTPGLSEGPHIVIEVSDTGSGIPPEVVERIFDPFFTTKPVGKGTGLGLSTVLGIVRNHGGVINLAVKTGSGTTFRIIVPATGGAAPASAGQREEPLPSGNGKTVLIADDEEMLRVSTRAVLEKHGYRTLVAADGIEALALFSQNFGTIDAVLTDMDMPNMGGVAFIRGLRRLRADLPVIVSTGQAQTVDLAKLGDIGVSMILKKPFKGEILLRTLDTMFKAGAKELAG